MSAMVVFGEGQGSRCAERGNVRLCMTKGSTWISSDLRQRISVIVAALLSRCTRREIKLKTFDCVEKARRL